jgi:hypothetical protein
LVAVAALVVLAGLGRVWRDRVLALFVASWCINAAVLTALPLVGPERSSKQLAQRLRDELRKETWSLRTVVPGEPSVYLDRTIGERLPAKRPDGSASRTSPGGEAAPLPTAEEFRKLWDSDRRVLVVASRRWPGNFASDGITHARLLWEGRSFVLLSNDRPGR